MARPRSRLLDLERDDAFDAASVAVHAVAGWTVLLFLLLLHLTAGAGLPQAAAVCAGLCFLLDQRNALLGFLCWAASGAVAAQLRVSSSTGWKVLHTFAGCEPRPGFRTTPPPSVVCTTAQRAASTVTPKIQTSVRGNMLSDNLHFDQLHEQFK